MQLNVACGRVTIDKSEGSITALATALIALYTLALWRATSGMLRVSGRQHQEMLQATRISDLAVRASRRMAEASIGVSLPWLYVLNVTAGGSAAVMSLASPSWRVTVSVVNYGNTPAFMRTVIINVGVYRDVPTFAQYRRDLPVEMGSVIRNDRMDDFVQPAYGGAFPEDDVASVIDGTATLLVFGQFVYRDFMGDEHTVSFSRVWSESQSAFVTDDRPRYNHRNYNPKEI